MRDFLGPHVDPQIVFEHGAAKERLFRDMLRGRIDRYLVPGVADVTPFGGGSKEYVAQVDPSRLRAYDVTLPPDTAALARPRPDTGARPSLGNL